ncbi:MAG: (d)CMP kinase, partial [Planctomycetota bacterium]
MIVTIDGPAGAGKSSAARVLAAKLGFRFLDTGAMYRAVTLAALEQGIDLDDGQALQQLAEEIDIHLTDGKVRLNGRDVTRAIRTFDITTATKHAADNQGVRSRLVELQRQAAAGHDVVTEGRDQASVVFPDAECKIFLTASDEVRAQRRYEDLLGRGEQVTFEEVLAKQQERDARDCSRPVGGLRKTPDTIEVSTDGMSPDEVVEQLMELVASRRPAASKSGE